MLGKCWASLLVGQFRLGSGPILFCASCSRPLPLLGDAHNECPGSGTRPTDGSLLSLCPQRTMPVAGPCGARAASSPAPTSPPSTITMPTARGPSWLNWETPSHWSLLTSSWRTVTTFWKSLGPKAPPSGKHTLPALSPANVAHRDTVSASGPVEERLCHFLHLLFQAFLPIVMRNHCILLELG